ncbi:hypothetical protein [Nannocystis pusilla]|uniref:hypothetical protein n=1 Tax=Nannocystis pusilla TaxID=889268 RepID=UPI003BF1454E
MTPIAPPVLITGLVFEAAPAPADGGEYEPAVGTSREEKEILAALEDKAAAKTASDYQHIVWAYGILWALFAAYGLFLWRRSARLRADVDALRQELARSGARGGPGA